MKLKAVRISSFVPVVMLIGAMFGLGSTVVADGLNGGFVAMGRQLDVFDLPVGKVVTLDAAARRDGAAFVSVAAESIFPRPDRTVTANMTPKDDSPGAAHYAARSIPEPAPLALLGVGVLGLGAVRRRAD